MKAVEIDTIRAKSSFALDRAVAKAVG